MPHAIGVLVLRIAPIHIDGYIHVQYYTTQYLQEAGRTANAPRMVFDVESTSYEKKVCSVRELQVPGTRYLVPGIGKIIPPNVESGIGTPQ
jgi:hypothetical protein